MVRALGRKVLTSAMILVLVSMIFIPNAVSAKPPTILISYPVEGATFRASELVELNASESFDPDEKSITVYWKSNRDGEIGYGEILRVKLSPGGHTITCEVEDGDGEMSSDTRTITILPLEPPVAHITADKLDVEVFEIVNFNASRSEDPDFGIAEFMFDFGDGDNTGWIKSNISSHSFKTPGTYRIRVDVKDNDGLTASNNMTIIVRGRTKVTQEDNSLTVYLLILLAVFIVLFFLSIIIYRRVRKKRLREEEERLRRRIERRTARARASRGGPTIRQRDTMSRTGARKVRIRKKG